MGFGSTLAKYQRKTTTYQQRNVSMLPWSVIPVKSSKCLMLESNGWERERRVVAIGGREIEQICSAVKADLCRGGAADANCHFNSAGTLANVATT